MMTKIRYVAVAICLIFTSGIVQAQEFSPTCAGIHNCDQAGCDSAAECARHLRLERFLRSIKGKGPCNPFFLRFGVGTVIFSESADIRIGGATVPLASVAVDDTTTFGFDLGYRMSERWSVILTTGAPLETTISGTGTLAGTVLGTTNCAPVMLSTQYHLPLGKRLEVLDDSTLYVGAGINYTVFYRSIDGAVQNLDIEDAVGSLVQLGFQKNFKNSLGAFAEVKRLFLKTDVTGQVGLAPTDADLTANATILGFGLTYGF